MPRPGIAAPALSIIALVLLLGLVATPAAMARQEASPAAGTPVVTAPPTQAAAQPAQTSAPAATPAAVVTTDVVTFVFWYANSANQDILEVLPLASDAAGVAGQTPGATPLGTIDFPEDGSPPTIVIGETTFTTYPRPDGVIERWTWIDDFEGARPATLVMQVSAQGGNYQDYFGTATLVSRDEGGAGGVLVLALRPPAPASAATPAAETPAAEAAPAEGAAAEAGTTGDVGTDVIEVEPAA